jgi:hypothetical protein
MRGAPFRSLGMRPCRACFPVLMYFSLASPGTVCPSLSIAMVSVDTFVSASLRLLAVIFEASCVVRCIRNFRFGVVHLLLVCWYPCYCLNQMGHLSLPLSRVSLRPVASSLFLLPPPVPMSQFVKVAVRRRCLSVGAFALLVSSFIATITCCWLVLVCN